MEPLSRKSSSPEASETYDAIPYLASGAMVTVLSVFGLGYGLAMRLSIQRTVLCAGLCLLALTLGACDDKAANDHEADGLQPLTIESASARHVFKIEVAVTEEQQMRGLMYRRHLDAGSGMLFVHDREDLFTMWMKNTYIPLDMVFIARNGRIARIAERTVPLSEAVVSSGEPVVAVLEINGGTASRLGIKAGDRVRSAALAKHIAPD